MVASDDMLIHRQNCLCLNSHPGHLGLADWYLNENFRTGKISFLSDFQTRNFVLLVLFLKVSKLEIIVSFHNLVALAFGDVALQSGVPTHWNQRITTLVHKATPILRRFYFCREWFLRVLCRTEDFIIFWLFCTTWNWGVDYRGKELGFSTLE